MSAPRSGHNDGASIRHEQGGFDGDGTFDSPAMAPSEHGAAPAAGSGEAVVCSAPIQITAKKILGRPGGGRYPGSTRPSRSDSPSSSLLDEGGDGDSAISCTQRAFPVSSNDFVNNYYLVPFSVQSSQFYSQDYVPNRKILTIFIPAATRRP